MIGIGSTIPRLAVTGGAGSTPASIFGPDDEWVWLDPNTAYAYQDTSGTVPSEIGDPVGLIIDRSGNGYDALRVTNDDYRVTLVQADNGDLLFQNDEIDDEMQITFPNLGAECTIAYVTQSEIRLLEDQTLNGAYTLPQHDLLGFVAVDRAMTKVEKIRLIRYLASKAQGVRYGADLDDMQLACINAVDVLIYDTSLDSDGGAWAVGAYPALMVIVAEAASVKIYDGADPSLPLHTTLDFTGYTVTSVAAVAGALSVGTSTGLAVFNLADGDTTVALDYTTATTPAIVSNTVNDVAVTVLPDAPIDPATGLPVPTIAVATAGGVSVIKDDGTVVDSAATSGSQEVSFNLDGLYYGITFGAYLYFATYADIDAGDGFGDWIGSASAGSQEIGLVARHRAFVASDTHLFGGGEAVLDAKAGLSIHSPDASNPATSFSDGMSALVTSTYNTGWMPGDIKGAFLADTDDTDLVATDTIADRSVNGMTLTLSDVCTVQHVATGAELVSYTLSSDETVTLGSDISSNGALIWWEYVSGAWQLNVNDLSGGADYVNGTTGTVSTGLTIVGTTLTFSASKPMSLARASATIPTAAQIAKIYEDERKLFEENAACTLYGASDAVTALAHDPGTDLLHVGTSAGRSVFRGLERIQNTTTSVSKAISAVNGLIAEK